MAAVSPLPPGAPPILPASRAQESALVNQQHSHGRGMPVTQQRQQQRCSLARATPLRPTAPPPPPEKPTVPLSTADSRSGGAVLIEHTAECALPSSGIAGGRVSSGTENSGSADAERENPGAQHRVMPPQTALRVQEQSPATSAEASRQMLGFGTSSYQGTSPPGVRSENKAGGTTARSSAATVPSSGGPLSRLTQVHAQHLPLRPAETEGVRASAGGGIDGENVSACGHCVPGAFPAAGLTPTGGENGVPALCSNPTAGPLQGSAAGGADAATACFVPVDAINLAAQQHQQYLMMLLQSHTQEPTGLLAGGGDAALSSEPAGRQHVLLFPHGHSQHMLESRRSSAATPHAQAHLAAQHPSSQQLGGVCPPHQQLLLRPSQQHQAGIVAPAGASLGASLVPAAAGVSAYVVGAPHSAQAVLSAPLAESGQTRLEATDGCDRVHHDICGYPVANVSVASRANTTLSVVQAGHLAHSTDTGGSLEFFRAESAEHSQFKSAQLPDPAEKSHQRAFEPSGADAKRGPRSTDIQGRPGQCSSGVTCRLDNITSEDGKMVESDSWSTMAGASKESQKVSVPQRRRSTEVVPLSRSNLDDASLPGLRGPDRPQHEDQRRLGTPVFERSGVGDCLVSGVSSTISTTSGPETISVETPKRTAAQEAHGKETIRVVRGEEADPRRASEDTMIVTEGREEERLKGVVESAGQSAGRRRLASEGDMTASGRERLYAQLHSARY